MDPLLLTILQIIGIIIIVGIVLYVIVFAVTLFIGYSIMKDASKRIKKR